jgi:DNA-binding NarL/FixJ family response regulator
MSQSDRRYHHSVAAAACLGIRANPVERSVARRDSVCPIATGPDTSQTTIVLADDHTIVRSALRALLEAEAEFEVVAEAGDVDESVRKVLAYKPQVIVLDLSMPGGSSLTAIPRLREASPETKIVVLTMENEPRFAREALRAGALGFVLKDAPTPSWSPPCARRWRASATSTRSSERSSPPRPRPLQAHRTTSPSAR